MSGSLRHLQFPRAGFLDFAIKFPVNSLYLTIVLLLAIATGASGAGTSEGEHALKTLRPCPSSPNCVSSQAADPKQRMAPIPFAGTVEDAQARLRSIIRVLPRTEITLDQPGYLAVSVRSRVFGFLDEVEFFFDGGRGVIHFRSGAHTGYYDFGVNRSRMERIAAAFAATGRER